VSDSTTARGKAAKKPTLVLRKSTSAKDSSAKPKKKPLPKNPPVDEGPKAVKSWRDGSRTTVRFFIAQFCGSQPYWAKKHRGQRGPYESKWYVMDVDSGKRAAGTNPEGYESQDEARQVARAYGKKYGAYTEVPF
jgi:hypothetical protein